MNTVCVPAASSANRQSRICAGSLSSANVCETAMPARAASQSGLAASANARSPPAEARKTASHRQTPSPAFAAARSAPASIPRAARRSGRLPQRRRAPAERFPSAPRSPRAANRQSAARARPDQTPPSARRRRGRPAPSFSQSEKEQLKAGVHVAQVEGKSAPRFGACGRPACCGERPAAPPRSADSARRSNTRAGCGYTVHPPARPVAQAPRLPRRQNPARKPCASSAVRAARRAPPRCTCPCRRACAPDRRPLPVSERDARALGKARADAASANGPLSPRRARFPPEFARFPRATPRSAPRHKSRTVSPFSA